MTHLIDKSNPLNQSIPKSMTAQQKLDMHRLLARHPHVKMEVSAAVHDEVQITAETDAQIDAFVAEMQDPAVTSAAHRKFHGEILARAKFAGYHGDIDGLRCIFNDAMPHKISGDEIRRSYSSGKSHYAKGLSCGCTNCVEAPPVEAIEVVPECLGRWHCNLATVKHDCTHVDRSVACRLCGATL